MVKKGIDFQNIYKSLVVNPGPVDRFEANSVEVDQVSNAAYRFGKKTLFEVPTQR